MPSPPEVEGDRIGTDFEQKISTWKRQGYNVSRLEQLVDTDMEGFWEVLPLGEILQDIYGAPFSILGRCIYPHATKNRKGSKPSLAGSRESR